MHIALASWQHVKQAVTEYRAHNITCTSAFQGPLSVLICMCWLVRFADACGMHSLTTMVLTVTDTSSSVRRSRLVRVPIQPPPSSGSAVSGWPTPASTLLASFQGTTTTFLWGLYIVPRQLLLGSLSHWAKPQDGAPLQSMERSPDWAHLDATMFQAAMRGSKGHHGLTA